MHAVTDDKIIFLNRTQSRKLTGNKINRRLSQTDLSTLTAQITSGPTLISRPYTKRSNKHVQERLTKANQLNQTNQQMRSQREHDHHDSHAINDHQTDATSSTFHHDYTTTPYIQKPHGFQEEDPNDEGRSGENYREPTRTAERTT